MTVLSWQLTVVAVGTTPISSSPSPNWWETRRRAVTAQSQKAAADMTATTQETLSISGIMLAKLFGRQDQESERFRTENQRLADLSVRLQMTGQSFFAVMRIFFSISPVAIYLIAGYLLTGSAFGGVTAGTLVAFTTLQSRLFFPMGSLLQVSVELQASLALFERIFGYLDIKPDITDSPGATRLDHREVRGRVSFKSVGLSYDDPSERATTGQSDGALRGVSFHVEPGQLAAFVGPSGAGKTTISYLIPRLYDPTEGSVLIDGLDIPGDQSRKPRPTHRLRDPGELPVSRQHQEQPPVRKPRGYPAGN